jgi:septal ring factor EnvC (AmiA/AmiB activator)
VTWALISLAAIALGFAASTAALALRVGGLREALAKECAESDRLEELLAETDKRLQETYLEIKADDEMSEELRENHKRDLRELRDLLEKCATPEVIREELNRMVMHA